MPGWFGVGRLAPGLFVPGSFFLQQFGSYMVVLVVLSSVCASWGRLRGSPRRRSRMFSLLSSRLVLKVVVAGLCDVAAIVLRPGCARRFVLVRHSRGRQWSGCVRGCAVARMGLAGRAWSQ